MYIYICIIFAYFYVLKGKSGICDKFVCSAKPKYLPSNHLLKNLPTHVLMVHIFVPFYKFNNFIDV